MKQVFTFLIFFISIIQIQGQSIKVFQADNSALWGLKDSKTNKVILKPEYDNIVKLTDTTLVKIIRQGKHGISRINGTIIIQPYYDKVKLLRNKKYVGTLNSKYALIDQNGKVILPLQDHSINEFRNGNYRIDNRKMQSGLLNAKGEIILPLKYTFSSTISHPQIILKKENNSVTFGLVDSLGHMVLPCEFAKIKPIQSGNSYCFEVKKDTQEYIVNAYGNKLELNQYDKITAWYGELPYIRTLKFESPEKKKALYGLVDFNGKEILPTEFTKIHELSKSYIQGNKKNPETNKVYKHLYNNKGKLLFGSKSIRNFILSPVNDNVLIKFRAPNSDLSWYEFYNLKTGKRISSDKYEKVKTSSSTTLALQKLSPENKKHEFQKFKLYNWDGEYLMKSYDSFRLMTPVRLSNNKDLKNRLIEIFNGPTVVNGKSIGEKYGIITPEGKEVLPFAYDELSRFHKNVAITTKISANNRYKYGLIDQDGNIISEPVFDYIFPPKKIRRSYKDATKVCTITKTKKKKWGVINLKYAKLIDAKYDYIDKLDKHTIVFNGTLSKDKEPLNGKYGVANCETGQVSQVKYDFIGELNPLTKVFIGTLDDIGRPLVGKYGFIDINGNEIVPVVYDYVAPNKHKENYEKVFQGEVDEMGLPIFETGTSYFVSPNGKIASFKELGSNTSIIKNIISSSFRNLNTLTILKKDKSKDLSFLFGVMDNECEVVVPFIYNFIGNYTPQGVAKASLVVKGQLKYGLINMKGHVVTPFEYDYIKINKEFGLHKVFKGTMSKFGKPESGKYGLLSSAGILITNPVYTTIGHEYNGMILVSKDNKYGYLNTEGQLVIPCIYDEAKRFYYRKAKVKLNGEAFTIDIEGKRVPEETNGN